MPPQGGTWGDICQDNQRALWTMLRDFSDRWISYQLLLSVNPHPGFLPKKQVTLRSSNFVLTVWPLFISHTKVTFPQLLVVLRNTPHILFRLMYSGGQTVDSLTKQSPLYITSRCFIYQTKRRSDLPFSSSCSSMSLSICGCMALTVWNKDQGESKQPKLSFATNFSFFSLAESPPRDLQVTAYK